jgi:HEAT repeat protein
VDYLINPNFQREFSMKSNLILIGTLLLAAMGAVNAQNPTPLLTQPADKLIAVIKSDASQKDKIDACRQLAVRGGKEAVAALVPLLSDEQMNHMARFALEPIPDPSVDQAFRDALGTLKGRPLVGVIGSIGVRKDTQAVPALSKFLQDSNPEVARAAARALGSIGDGTAIQALQNGLRNASPGVKLAFCEGLLRAAEGLAKSDAAKAAAVYTQLRGIELPQQVRAAVVRGTILTADGEKRSALLQEELRSEDYVRFAAAISAVYQLPTPDVTKVLAGELPKLSQDDRKTLVIQALGKRSDSAALSALATAAKAQPKNIRLAAVHALAETGNAAAAPVLTELLVSDEREISQAAMEGMAGLQGQQIDQAVQAMLKSEDAARRVAGIELVGRRRMTGNLPDLLKAATDTSAPVRPIALSKVGELGTSADVPAVLDILPKLSAPADLDAAEQALSSLCSKSGQPEQCTSTLTSRFAQLGAPQKSVILRTLSTIGGADALKAVRAALRDSNTQVHAAAVRALGAWKTADAAPDLLALAKNASNPTDQTLSLRSYLGMAANPDVPTAQRLEMCREASSLVKNAEEKQLLLSAMGSIDSLEAVNLILPYLDDASTREEASAAVTSIADRMLKALTKNPNAAQLAPALEKVAKATTNEQVAKRAQALQQQAQKLNQ